jgi:hypothetical protein
VVAFVGTFVPSMFFGALWHTNTHGFSLTLAWAYNVLRIGPYFMNFAYVYTLCHKEGHSQLGLFAKVLSFFSASFSASD